MTYENFEKYIKFVQARREFLNAVGKVLGDYFESWVSLEGEYEDHYIALLEDIFNDECGWISYWIYELDFGKKAKKNTIVDIDGKNIPIKTIKNLYDLINEKDN